MHSLRDTTRTQEYWTHLRCPISSHMDMSSYPGSGVFRASCGDMPSQLASAVPRAQSRKVVNYIRSSQA
ncbi:hypothetical protein [Streptomyces europaeiscabiei]|uniref:hypothetical protein n=1 Tax=Streptomyces europaeiscabiei TaxID=146819 RepID=UPI0006282D73|nr:hypothetical protein [Streptomyces europaeiscabiei]